MPRLSPPIRRVFAAFAAVMVLLAPVTQVAHAQAMAMGDAPGCNHPAASHQHVPASSHHSESHQHDGTCCDFCAAGCATAVVVPAEAVAMPATLASVVVVASGAAHHLHIVPLPHLLPFSLAPPTD